MSPTESPDEAAARLKCVAPRVTEKDLKDNIVHEEYVTHVTKSGQVLRWCVLTTKSGFACAGEPSAAASKENDRQELGERYARENAVRALWPLMAYELKSRLTVGQVSL
jgi:hypothetical protein